jgi:hypothetical protein
MDIYSFFNSPDVAEHCRSIGHKLNALESAIIIQQCNKHSVAEKHSAFRYIIDNCPDIEVPKKNHYSGSNSFIEALHIIISYQNDMLEKFLLSEAGTAYQARVYDIETWKPVYTDHFSCF